MVVRRVEIKTRGHNLTKTLTAKVRTKATRALRGMADDTRDRMKDYIRSSIKRPDGSTGRLENGIFVTTYNELHYGVGNISYLNGNVAYWRHQDLGSTAIGADWKHRVPTGSFTDIPQPVPDSTGQGTWQPGGLNFSFIPTKPIPPMNYTARTIRDVPSIIDLNLQRTR